MINPGPTSLERTQRWVLSALIAAVALFPSGALIAVTHVTGADDPAAAVLLCAITGVLGVIALAAILLVHRRSVVSPLLVIGLVPAVCSAIWTFGF